MKNHPFAHLFTISGHTPDDDSVGCGKTCHVTKTDILLIPNFIGQKAIFREKVTFCPPPGLQSTSQKLMSWL